MRGGAGEYEPRWTPYNSKTTPKAGQKPLKTQMLQFRLIKKYIHISKIYPSPPWKCPNLRYDHTTYILI